MEKFPSIVVRETKFYKLKLTGFGFPWWGLISNHFGQLELLTWEKKCSFKHALLNSRGKKHCSPSKHASSGAMQGWCPKPNYWGLYTGKNIKEKKPEHRVLLLLQHYIVCGWVLFLLAFQQMHIIQLSIISIFDLPWDHLLWFYGVSAFHIAAASGENTLGQRQAEWYFHRHCTGLSRDCLFFFFPPSFFSPPNHSRHFVEEIEPIFQYEYANLKKKCTAIPLKTYSNHY